MTKALTESCYKTGRVDNLHRHHVFFGTGNRKLSEKYGMVVMLTGEWHNQSSKGVHFNKQLDIEIKQFAQRKFIEMYPDLDFIKIFGRNYL